MTTDIFGTAAPRSRTLWRPRLHGTIRRFRTEQGSIACRTGSPVTKAYPIERATPLKLKAAFDQVVAAVAIILLLPLLMAIAAAIRLDSPGPVIFRQRRHGLGHSEFVVFKFRTMTWAPQLNAGDGRTQTRRCDSRITRIGNFLRNTSLDELPQLFNVLNGSMSLVGPRPHPVAMRTQGRLCEDVVSDYARRHRVRPGITGWAQVNGHRGATETVEQLQRRVEHDLYYVEHRCFLFDLKILLLTPIRIVFDRGNAF